MNVRFRWATFAVSAALASTLAIGGCDSPGAITRPLTRTEHVGRLDSWIPQLSVTAEDGTAYTIDLQHHELLLGTTDIYELTPTQEADLVNRFYSINQIELRLAELGSGAPGGGPGINDVAMPIAGGMSPIFGPCGGAAPPRTVQVRKASFVAVQPSPVTSGQLYANLPGFGAAQMDAPFSCLDIANAIANLKAPYKAAKAAYIVALVATLKSFFEFDGNWVPHWKTPSPTTVVATDLAASTLISINFQLKILTGLYAGQGCMSNEWNDATAAASIAGSIYSLQCHGESGWEISVDGGSSWSPVTAPVSVCEVVA